jgi:serine/threonine protein phosphatase PrpC
MNIYTVSLRGIRETNEDKHSVILNMNGENKNIANINFFGIYDGHGGKFVSKFIENKLPSVFTDSRVKYPIDPAQIHTLYESMQNILKKNFTNESTNCGSTCLVVAHYKDSKDDSYGHLNVINLGDSRCVLCRDNIGISLTKDHKPNWPEERHRITQLGGKITKEVNDDWRIRDLAVSRAFGDIESNPYVSFIPDVFQYKLEKKDKFMVIACDGLWDVMDPQETINFVLNHCYDDRLIGRINKTLNIARKLAEHAIQKGSGDNVTIIVVFFS